MDLAPDLTQATLEDELALCLVLRKDEQRYQRATARWLARTTLRSRGHAH